MLPGSCNKEETRSSAGLIDHVDRAISFPLPLWLQNKRIESPPKESFFFLFDPYGLVVIVPERADTQRQGENIKDGQDNNTVRLSVGQSN